MITLDILEQRLLQFPYFDACLVCLFSIIISPIFIFPIKTLRISIKIINLFEFGFSFNKLCYENINIQKNDCAIHLTR